MKLANIFGGVKTFFQANLGRRLLIFTNRLIKGELTLLAYEDYDDYIRDTANSCISVRATLRAVCSITFDGTDRAKAESAFRNGEGFTTQREFVEQVSNNLDVFGNSCYYLKKDVSTDSLDLLSMPDMVFYLDRRQVVAYGVRKDPQKPPVGLEAKQVLHFKTTNAFSTIGRSIVASLSEYLKMKRYLSASWARNLQNDGVPSGYIKYKSKGKTEEQLKQVLEDWERKYSWNSEGHRVGVLDGDGDYVPIQSRGLDYGSDHNKIRDGVREGFRTPKVILGDTDGVNFSNAFTSLLAFKLTELDPFHQKLGGDLTYFFQNNGYDVTVTVKGTLDLEDFRAIAGATGRLQVNAGNNE